MATETAATGRRVRLLLLFCTLVGLAAMHTLGHGAHASAGHGTGHPDGHPIASVAMTTNCPGDGCPVSLLPLGDLGGHSSGWSICLAVLGAIAVALLVAVLLRAGSRVAGSAVGDPFRVASASRAPPTRPYGLRLATVSVSRR